VPVKLSRLRRGRSRSLGFFNRLRQTWQRPILTDCLRWANIHQSYGHNVHLFLRFLPLLQTHVRWASRHRKTSRQSHGSCVLSCLDWSRWRCHYGPLAILCWNIQTVDRWMFHEICAKEFYRASKRPQSVVSCPPQHLLIRLCLLEPLLLHLSELIRRVHLLLELVWLVLQHPDLADDGQLPRHNAAKLQQQLLELRILHWLPDSGPLLSDVNPTRERLHEI